MDVVGVLAPVPLERPRGRRPPRRSTSAASTAGSPARPSAKSAAPVAGPPAEDEQVGEGVAAEPVGAVHPARHLAGGEEAGHGGRLGVGVHPDPAHHVVAGRAHLHGLGGDVDAGQLHELVVHGGQPAPDVLGRAAAGDVEEDPAVGAAPTRLHLAVDGPGHLVTGEEVRGAPVVDVVLVPAVGLFLGLGRLGPEHGGHVVEHEPRALAVAQDPAVAPDPLGDQQAAHRQRPHHARWGGTARTPSRSRRPRPTGPWRGRRRWTPSCSRCTCQHLPIDPVASTTALAAKVTNSPVGRQ